MRVPPRDRPVAFAAAAALALMWPGMAVAQGLALPSRPISLADGRVVLGGDASVGYSSSRDEPAWFNYTAYENNVLRTARAGLAADIRLAPRVSVLAQVLAENGRGARVHALYLRARPYERLPLDIQAGRIPPTFGAFARRHYGGSGNPLIGYPLAYQYLTSLRPDAVPVNADDLLRNRAGGWRPAFLTGSRDPSTGLPLVAALDWDTGVQGRIASGSLEMAGALTVGTLSDPRVRDNNGGRQVAARAAWQPRPGLVAGFSAARGAYLADAVTSALPAGADRRPFVQRAWGLDVEYSRAHWIVRAEGLTSAWTLPGIAEPRIGSPLRATSVSIEGRYMVRPGAFVAARYDRLAFSRLAGTATTLPWDAPVARVEGGGGYYLQRNLVGKLTYQQNWRDAGVRRLGIWAGQLQYWF